MDNHATNKTEAASVLRPAAGSDPCGHEYAKEVGSYQAGLGTIVVRWCPTCGGIHQKMINWKYIDYGWEFPSQNAKDEHA